MRAPDVPHTVLKFFEGINEALTEYLVCLEALVLLCAFCFFPLPFHLPCAFEHKKIYGKCQMYLKVVKV